MNNPGCSLEIETFGGDIAYNQMLRSEQAVA
jgi:hypothetical protein